MSKCMCGFELIWAMEKDEQIISHLSVYYDNNTHQHLFFMPQHPQHVLHRLKVVFETPNPSRLALVAVAYCWSC